MTTLARDTIVDYLDRMLVGPANGPTELASGLPTKRYLMGILFPRAASADAALQDELVDVTGTSEGDMLSEDPIALAGQWLPASIGLSLYVADDAEVTCRVWGAEYTQETEAKQRRWRRRSIAEESEPEELPLPGDGTASPVLDGRARLQVRRRPLNNGTLLTVSLMNARLRNDDHDPSPAECLFQVGLEIDAGANGILEYPSVKLLSRDPEEQELRLLHREAKTFAIGHGCAVSWTGSSAERQTSARSVLIPRHVVHGVTQKAPEGLDDRVLDVARLGNTAVKWQEMKPELEAFVGAYAAWIAMQEGRSDVPSHLDRARIRVTERLRTAESRMREGIQVLDDNPQAREAFGLANRALATQNLRQGTDYAGKRRRRADDSPAMDADLARSTFRWYPFQLAFQLLVLPSLIDANHEHRRDVDLIWFPTGGGKTEAYLAVAATEIFLRRLRDPVRGAGTAVLTRYTLRLLTTQQFQRAAATICACEQLRRSDEERLGTEPISIGLWVGEAAAPNKCASAAELFQEVRESDKPENPFQLETCPWCGTEIIPLTASLDDADYGIEATLEDFRLFCPAQSCPFHQRLPVQVVDEALYARPTTLLLGTVDKFARLTWDADGGAFFGAGGDYAPPSLIIQDELHLLSGPLGTTVGVYEAAIEALCARDGVAPKIVASTATIRRSDDQVRSLFAGRSVRLFPPSGVDAKDSFFARTDFESPGRLYVGVMAQSHTLSTAMVHLSAALLQGVYQLEMTEPERDAYWTLVAYHNSLRELGRTVTIARDDVPARLQGIASTPFDPRPLGDEDVVELTGNVGGTSTILEQMKRRHGDAGVISLLACTNMLSVGVDVSRLGLMLVNGQPKTTSEYIQATSRVGRGVVPGLVVSLYTATKPRDRSHYEAFRPYHASLYRYVEPTSVTPWSSASRDRALHAAFVMLVRHLGGLTDNASASAFDPQSAAVAQAMAILTGAVAASDGEELADTRAQLERLAEEWNERVADARGEHKTLYFKPAGRAVRSLLKDFGDKQPGWPTLNSMRNVDREALVRVRGEDK